MLSAMIKHSMIEDPRNDKSDSYRDDRLVSSVYDRGESRYRMVNCSAKLLPGKSIIELMVSLIRVQLLMPIPAND